MASLYCALQIAVADFFRSFLSNNTFAVHRFVVMPIYTVSASAHNGETRMSFATYKFCGV